MKDLITYPTFRQYENGGVLVAEWVEIKTETKVVKNLIPKDEYQEVVQVAQGVAIVRINPQEEGNFFLVDEMTMRVSDDKGQEIARLIKINYPTDTMEAIRNNMDAVRDGLIEDQEKAEEYKAEYLAMQAWRKKAKEIVERVYNLKSEGDEMAE